MKIFLVEDVMELLRVSRPTIYRWLAARRKGMGNFPLPISEVGHNHRWFADDIEQYIKSRSTVQPSARVASSKQAKSFQERQQRVSEMLQKHGITINLTEKGT